MYRLVVSVDSLENELVRTVSDKSRELGDPYLVDLYRSSCPIHGVNNLRRDRRLHSHMRMYKSRGARHYYSPLQHKFLRS